MVLKQGHGIVALYHLKPRTRRDGLCSAGSQPAPHAQQGFLCPRSPVRRCLNLLIVRPGHVQHTKEGLRLLGGESGSRAGNRCGLDAHRTARKHHPKKRTKRHRRLWAKCRSWSRHQEVLVQVNFAFRICGKTETRL